MDTTLVRNHGRQGKSKGERKGRNRSEKASRRYRGGKSQFRKTSSSKTLVGRIQKNARGFAFVLPKDSTEQDSYVSKEQARLLLNDDIVEYIVHREGSRSSAEIKRIVERGQTKMVGKIRQNRSGTFFETPDGEYFDLEGKTPPPEHWAIAEVVEFASPRSSASVSVKKDLGSELKPSSDYEIAINEFGLRNQFPERVHDNAEAVRKLGEAEMKNPPQTRKDLRHLPFITIDGEDAKDFDDAVFVQEESQGFSLFVAIADVSFYVRWNSPLDVEARERSTSVYFPGRAIPMLPEELSNDLCSLRPKEDKLTVTAEVHYDSRGNVTHKKFYESIIKTARRCTYTEIHAFIEKDPSAPKELEALSAPLTAAFKLYKLLDKQRSQRGVLDFDLGETSMELDKSGMPVRVFRAPRFHSHKLIEEFMIAANSAVAEALRIGNARALYRVHDTPETDKLDEINQLMKSLGISHLIREATPKAFSAALAATHGIKGAKTVHQNILRAQKQARYEPDPRGHFGLALRDYAHFTSPIRRYPDLVVHRALKQFILRQKSSDKEEDRVDYEALGELTSSRERRAMEAERWVTRRKQCWFMEERVGNRYIGVIAGITEKGLFVEIPEFAIEGFLPMDSMPGLFQYDEAKLCLRMRPGHFTLSLGDEVPILVDSVSVIDNEITLGYDDETPLNRHANIPSV
jgi:ribonuclease R